MFDRQKGIAQTDPELWTAMQQETTRQEPEEQRDVGAKKSAAKRPKRKPRRDLDDE